MALRLSVFTTLTNPTIRGDHWRESIASYLDLADELVIVNGGEDLGLQHKKIKLINYEWPREFDWPFIGQQFQRGYEATTGDWVIHADLDMVFHEQDFERIRLAIEQYVYQPALSFWKYQFILPDRYNLKSRLALAVNKKMYAERIKFNSGGDLCQPSLDNEQIPVSAIEETRVPVYNYEKITKTADQIAEDCGRMDRAYNRHFKSWQLSTDASGSDESCFDGYIRLLKGRFNKPQQQIALDEHPKYMQATINSLSSEQFGYNGFGLFGDNNYVRELSRC